MRGTGVERRSHIYRTLPCVIAESLCQSSITMKVYHSAIVMFATLLVTGCAYYPHLTDVPLIREKGDTRLEAGCTIVASSFSCLSFVWINR
jgi:hypothetical protein